MGSKAAGVEEPAKAPPKEEPKKEEKSVAINEPAKKADKEEAKENGGPKDKVDKPDGGNSDDDASKAKPKKQEMANPITPGDVEEFYKFGKEIGK